MAGVITASEPSWIAPFTGLRVRDFRKLVTAMRREGADTVRPGRPWRLPLEDRVLLVAAYWRTNLTLRQLAPLFGVSKSAADRIIDHIGPLLALRPRRRFRKDAVLIVDGTLVPTRDHTIAAQSKNYRYSTNHQVVIDAHTRLVVAVGKPVPGNRNDCKAWAESGAAAAWRQRRGRVPALNPVGPVARCTLDRRGPGAVPGPRRRIGVAESSNGAVDPVEVAGPLALLHGRRRADRVQGRSGQSLQPGTAVQQQDLADRRGEPAGTALVAPVAEDRKNLPDRGVDRALAEDPVGESGPLEASDLLERGKAAEEVGVGDHERAGVRADLTAPPTSELGPGPVDQVGPVLVGPAPVAAAEFTTADQDKAGRVAGEPSLVAGAWSPAEAVPGVGQRLDQPPRGCRGRQSQASDLLDPQGTERLRLGMGQQGSPVVAGEVKRPYPVRCIRAARGQRRGRRRQRFTPPGWPARVSMSMRQEWICCMPRFSFSARSRPDRWM